MTKINDQINEMLVPLLSNPESAADALEAVANGMASIIAILSKGSNERANELLTGTEGYVQNCLADKLKIMRKIVG